MPENFLVKEESNFITQSQKIYYWRDFMICAFPNEEIQDSLISRFPLNSMIF